MPEINYIEHMLKQQGLTHEEERTLQDKHNSEFMEIHKCTCSKYCYYNAHWNLCDCKVSGTSRCRAIEQGKKLSEKLGR